MKAEELKQLMEAFGFTAYSLAQLLCTTQPTINRWLNSSSTMRQTNGLLNLFISALARLQERTSEKGCRVFGQRLVEVCTLDGNPAALRLLLNAYEEGIE